MQATKSASNGCILIIVRVFGKWQLHHLRASELFKWRGNRSQRRLYQTWRCHYACNVCAHAVGTLVISCKWTFTEKDVAKPISDQFSLLRKKNYMTEAMAKNSELQKRIGPLFPDGRLCADTEGWFWRVLFHHDATLACSGIQAVHVVENE